MQRACAASLLAKGESIIRHPGNSNDDLAALSVIQALGARIEHLENGDIRISGTGINPIDDTINCGESGLGIRMFAPLAALATREILINGSGSLLKRPMNFFDEILPQLKVDVSSNNGHLPIRLRGPLQPADITIDGSLSSQFLTGLLMAFAAAEARGVTITVTDLKSKPYIDLTLDVLKKFGVSIENRDYRQFYFPGNTSLSGTEYTVEGDWSGGAFLLVAGAISGEISVKGLDVFSSQADKQILRALADSGARMSVREDAIDVAPSPLKAFHFDATDCPDLFPPLVALASYCEGTTAIVGVNRLTHKESNRALTLQDEFGKMGVVIRLQDDLMLIEGGVKLEGAHMHSRHDHRIAMACAIAAAGAQGSSTIEEAEAINKSYPQFYKHMRHLGMNVFENETVNS